MTVTQSLCFAASSSSSAVNVLASGTSATTWFRNNGAQNFFASVVSTAVAVPRSAVFSDLNGDGAMDVVW